ncbi:MAG: RcpC/CpaB family pilus assembly protein [Oscillospiraceae bacterium]|nr:RcpC/CpaB family pilus assembly protein [Oscillospiraceae bacterium]
MKDLLKNRIVVGLLCIITALIICFGLTPMFNDALKSKVELVRVTTEIKKGDQITAGMITAVETGGYNLPSDVIYKKEDAIGKYANADLYKGDSILKSKLSDTPQLKNEYLSGLDGTNRAISVTIKSFAAGLSGKLERGDIVSLIASDVGEARKTLIPDELQYVEIIATTDSSGNDRNIQEQPKDSGDTELASTITVLATPQQARLLAELEQTGKLHAALVYRGGAEDAQKFLDEQAKLLEALYPVKSEGLTYETENNDGTQPPAPDSAAEGVSVNGTIPDTQN